MAKLTLSNITSGYATNTAVNSNNDLIEVAVENTLSRDGTAPNTMGASIDMNGFNILNQGNPITVSGLVWEGPWLTTTLYTIGDIIQYAGTAYIAIVTHTSGTFATDLADLKWQVFVQSNLPTQTGNSGKVLSTDGSNTSWSSVDSKLPSQTGNSGKVLSSNGTISSWGFAEEGKYSPSGTGAVSSTISNKLKEIISVKDFGAIGDGIVDDTAAIQNAINYAQSIHKPDIYGSTSPLGNSNEVIFPFGYYKLTDALIITRSISFKGEGHSEFSGGARLVQNTNNKDIFKVTPIAQGNSVSWTDLTMLANGGGGTGGSLINITTGPGTCNSVRIIGCTFGTPQTLAIKIQKADDVMIHDNLFDVSAQHCISLGTGTSTDVVTNCSIHRNTIFSLSLSGILLYNVIGLLIDSNRIYPSSTNLTIFLDGTNTTPYQIKNVCLSNNSFRSVDCIAKLHNSIGVIINGNIGELLGAAGSSIYSVFEFTGTVDKLSIVNNNLSGALGTKNFYNDAGATITSCVISSNCFKATSGTGQALVCASTNSGTINNNTLQGFTSPSLSQQFFTTGNAVSVGTVVAGGSNIYTTTVTGAKQGDPVRIIPASTSWFTPVGIEIGAYISASNTVSVAYRNVTASPIGVPAHDIGINVERSL